MFSEIVLADVPVFSGCLFICMNDFIDFVPMIALTFIIVATIVVVAENSGEQSKRVHDELQYFEKILSKHYVGSPSSKK